MKVTKDYIQEKVLGISESEKRIILSWATGTGKSLAFIRMQDYYKPKKTYVVVPEIALIDNWKEEYHKYGYDYLLECTEIFCYNSLNKHVGESVDMLCLDEGHHASSELRTEWLSTITPERVVVLTATMDSTTRAALEGCFGRFSENCISQSKAIEYGLIPNPKVYLIPLELDNLAYNQDYVKSWGLKKNRKVVECQYGERFKYMSNKSTYKSLELHVKCTESQKNSLLDSDSNFYKRAYFLSREPFLKNKWMQAGSQRKRYLGELKDEYVKILLGKLDGKRYICFCTSIEQADRLGKEENTIHSLKRDSPDVISNFNSGKIDEIFAVGMLTEGKNLADIDAGVLVQLDGQERPFIQKSGRALRAKEPLLFIFYFKNTRDEEYLAKIIEGINPQDIVVVDSLQDLKL